ncbi:hypothetical protein BDV59DRAFT_192067 [Aspergillus ambiguus]|uniref:KAR9 family protein n=1 Tax=Aspergillus ambiguus TaxID=176160 RepID=UPI003CCDA0D4
MDESIESDYAAAAPPVRASSPSPSIPPTPAISSCPSPDRTFSTVSSLSTSSATSADARSSVSVSSKRRGYIRPQGAEFAESAKNRESVMSLGSIAHLQYYFARTGLLDGKGGHAREWKKKKQQPEEEPRLLLTPNARFIDDDLTTSPTQEGIDPADDAAAVDDDGAVMLPPTVSTYSIKTHHIPPPPDLLALRKDLLDALNRAEKSIDRIGSLSAPSPDMQPPRINLPSEDAAAADGDEDAEVQKKLAEATPQGWREIQGMRILDVVTLAIRAAKIYYTAHERPERLATIKSEREIRQELFNTLEVLKRWASRHFVGGLRDDERLAILAWMSNVREMLREESRLELLEAKEREGWSWIEGDWTGREREREEAFLRSLMVTGGDSPPLPTWSSPDSGALPTPLLERLRDGRDLVRMHNQAVKKSKRPFYEIKSFHQDVRKPYRCAENLRFWLKAAELRWETKLEMDVMGVVHGQSDEAWQQFDTALLVWCKAVREELTQDWGNERPGRWPSGSESEYLRAMFTTSTTSAAPPSDPPRLASASPVVLSSSSSPPPPPPPAVSVSPPAESPPRRIASKSSLRSLRSFGSSSAHEDDHPDTSCLEPDKSLVRPSILRRLSPGLAARVKLLDGSHKTTSQSRHSPSAIGRIPEEHLKELDSQHQDLSIRIQKKGRAWNGLQLTERTKQRQPSSGSLEDRPKEQRSVVSESDPFEEEQDQEPEYPRPTATMSTVDSIPVVPAAPETEPNRPEQTDFEKYVKDTRDSEAMPPPPPPKDGPRPPSGASNSTSNKSFRKSRPASLYSFSSMRVSFIKQVTQLTNLSLPQPAAMEASIASISGAAAAVKAVVGTGENVQMWIGKAVTIMGGLDVEDEVEWAASGGREGLEAIDKAIARFDGLINAYVKIIEDVQSRDDIADASSDNLETIVRHMDTALQSWGRAKSRLREIKGHVELAMEWEELWDSVFGDVESEVDELIQLLYDIEEKRHRVMMNTWPHVPEPNSHSLDISELETIVEETPSNGGGSSNKRLSVGSIFAVPPTLDTPIIQTPQDDSGQNELIAVFARIQPLKASVQFLPMRLAMFQSRAEDVYPSACEDIDDRRNALEENFRSLEKEAESLRKEFSEDRWILVFRNAGAQAHKMFESVERSIVKLQDGIESGAHVHNPASIAKRIESYEAKKQHYIPAIERVISIIEKGINDRLTVNGETMMLMSDMKNKVDALKASIKVMDSSIEDLNIPDSQQLRDSISTIVTMDSPATGSAVDTPGSSPASSVVMTPGNHRKGATTPLGSSSRRGSSVSSAARSTLSKVRRYSGLAQPPSTLTTKKSAIPKLVAPSPAKTNIATTPTPATRKAPSRPASSLDKRPRWNSSTNTNDLDVGHTRKPPSLLDKRPRWNSSTNTNDLEVGHVRRPSPSPSAFRKLSSSMSRPTSTLPGFSRRDLTASPAPSAARSSSRISSRLASRSPGRTESPTPTRSILDPPPYSKLRRPAGQENFPTTPRNRQSYAGLSFSRSVSQDQKQGLFSPTKSTRPGTALGHSGSRRISLLPLPKARSGRDSAAGSRSKLSERPPWR